ncbi:MAG TPA: substrate-binding domain-containing protein, partial [Chloroflexota bacterium]|nr:substrate-binding domain-containing protein [Chloroflexota bacterium]
AVAALLLVSSPLPVGMRAPDASAASGPTAMQQVANALKPPAWNGPTGAFQAMRAKGKHVFFINLTEEIPALHEWGAVMAQQLKLVGVSTKVCDAKGAPEGIITCMQQGIAQHPDLIVAAALDTKFIAGYMSQAKNAGIKLITGQTGIPGIPTATGDLAEATFNYQTVGNLLGAWYAADSGCKTAPQIITSTSSRQPSLAEVAGILSEIKLLCPHITPLPVQNVLIPDWATKLPTLTRSLLLAHKDLTYLLPLYDGMTLYMVQQIQQMNLGRPVKIGSFNATPVVMQNELAKTSPLAADVGGPNQWYGYALADQALRVLTGTAPVADEQVPLRLFTRANIGTINVKADESTWYGSVNVNCKYHTLWHIAC